ncbi:glycosyltransferase family 2 protein [Derxia lacustris]|uniref:glycosyltransferase family 2 protein n=1 Tax=Derxia lacustris TaxID=764842 RepID=UPI00111C3E9C|nr:glycosyltransferase family 2 protein [Derxia lacustris]
MNQSTESPAGRGRAGAARTTVIVLTHNRRDQVLVTLARLLDLPEAPPVLLVDNASSDGTVEAVQARFPRVEVVRSPCNLGAAGRNLGAERARTAYIAFCDDDCEWQPGALARAAMLFEAFPAVGVLCARLRLGNASGIEDPVSSLMAASPLAADGLPGRPVLGLVAGACVMRRDLFVAMGGYRRELTGAGAQTLFALDCAAARWLLLYCPELIVTRRAPAAPAAARWQQARDRVWLAWLRLPLHLALRETAAGLVELARAGHLWRGALGLWRDGAFARAERRVLPSALLRDWRLSERLRRRSERAAARAEAARRASPAAIGAALACDDALARLRRKAGSAAAEPALPPDPAGGISRSGDLHS